MIKTLLWEIIERDPGRRYSAAQLTALLRIRQPEGWRDADILPALARLEREGRVAASFFGCPWWGLPRESHHVRRQRRQNTQQPGPPAPRPDESLYPCRSEGPLEPKSSD
jgi:hypothetical protein